MRPCLYTNCREPAAQGRGVCRSHLEALEGQRPRTYMQEFFAYETVGMALPCPARVVPIEVSHFPAVSWADTTGQSWDFWVPKE